MVENPYLIALDLDGTLLNNNKIISKSTVRYLKKLKDLHYVVIATGRPFRSFKKYYDQLELNTPMVCYNGAYVTHPLDKDFPSTSFSFPKQVAIQIYLDLVSMLDNVMCETNDFIWMLKKELSLASFFWLDNMHIYYGDISKTLQDHPMTMILKSKTRSVESDALVFAAIAKHPNLKVRFWGDSLFSEVYYEDVSKGHALAKILQHYHIPLDRFISFGDAENDLEMLSMSPHSHAMINGTKEAKHAAAFTTEKNHHQHGVLHTLKTKFKLL
jgi:Cof subfamily protein (haloacid dehalogenase superfamily)